MCSAILIVCGRVTPKHSVFVLAAHVLSLRNIVGTFLIFWIFWIFSTWSIKNEKFWKNSPFWTFFQNNSPNLNFFNTCHVCHSVSLFCIHSGRSSKRCVQILFSFFFVEMQDIDFFEIEHRSPIEFYGSTFPHFPYLGDSVMEHSCARISVY